MTDPAQTAKRVAAEAAVDEIEAGMIVGLGTGTTAAFAISALGRRVADGLAVTIAGTSLATERAARAAGLTITPFGELDHVDLAIDGADQIDPQFRAIKGGGGAHLREKIIADAATRMICIVDPGKLADILHRALPIEVLPFARGAVSRAIVSLGGEPRPRLTDAGTIALSDQANLLIDCDFGPIADPAGLAAALDGIPGLLGHGLFLREIDALFIGTPDGVERRLRETNPF